MPYCAKANFVTFFSSFSLFPSERFIDEERTPSRRTSSSWLILVQLFHWHKDTAISASFTGISWHQRTYSEHTPPNYPCLHHGTAIIHHIPHWPGLLEGSTVLSLLMPWVSLQRKAGCVSGSWAGQCPEHTCKHCRASAPVREVQLLSTTIIIYIFLAG